MSALAVVTAHSTIVLPHIRYLAILPEIVMLGGAVLLLGIASLVRWPLRVTVSTVGTIVIAGTSLGLALWQWADISSHGPYTAIDHAVVVDGFSVLITITVACAMILSALVGDGYLRREGVDGCEFHVLAMVSATGAMFMGEANDLIIVFLGLEIMSIALYVLAAMNHRRAASGEAALKYFVLGGFSSAVFIYGVALTYGATGTTNLTQIADFLSHNVIASNGVLLAGLSLLLVGFLFKVAAVPFHMWTPDVYQGAPSPVTGFMAAVAKAGGFAALLRVFVSSFGTLQSDWRPILYAVAVITLLFGAGVALVQRDVKRVLAYSSINHAGFVLLGVEAATAQGVSASLYYLFTYTFMTIGAFAVVTLLGRRGDGHHDIASYRGLAGRQPLLALAFAVLLLAQAGAPFTTGFLAKFQVVDASVNAGSVPLAVIAMVSAAIAAFFYLRIGLIMYTPVAGKGFLPGIEPLDDDEANAGPSGESETDGTGDAAPAELSAGNGQRPVWSGTEGAVVVRTQLNAELLLDTAPGEVQVLDPSEDIVEADAVDDETAAESAAEDTAKVPVPALAALAIGLCVAVTVVFGVIPAPLIDFAHKATLLFIP